MKPDRLEVLSSYTPDEIQEFLMTRKTASIPTNMQEYILQMDTVARLFHYNKLNVSSAIDQLRKEWPSLTISAARSIYYDALEYYYIDENRNARAWDLVYADFFDNLARLSVAANKLHSAQRAASKAHELRTKQRESEGFNWHAPAFYININVKPEDLGYTSQKLADIARRHEDNQFKELILGLETSDSEKKRLLSEAGIKEVDFVKSENNETNEYE